MRLRGLFGIGGDAVSELHVKVVRDRWGDELIVLHRGLKDVVAILMASEWERLLIDLAEQRDPVAPQVAKPPRGD